MNKDKTSRDDCQVIPNKASNNIPDYALPLEDLLYSIPDCNEQELDEVENAKSWFFPPFMQRKPDLDKSNKKPDKDEKTKLNAISKDMIGILPNKSKKEKEDDDSKYLPPKKRKKK